MDLLFQDLCVAPGCLINKHHYVTIIYFLNSEKPSDSDCLLIVKLKDFPDLFRSRNPESSYGLALDGNIIYRKYKLCHIH